MPILSQLLKAETAEREVRSTPYQLKAARFPVYRDFAGFDFTSSEVARSAADRHLAEPAVEDAGQGPEIQALRREHLVAEYASACPAFRGTTGRNTDGPISGSSQPAGVARGCGHPGGRCRTGGRGGGSCPFRGSCPAPGSRPGSCTASVPCGAVCQSCRSPRWVIPPVKRGVRPMSPPRMPLPPNVFHLIPDDGDIGLVADRMGGRMVARCLVASRSARVPVARQTGGQSDLISESDHTGKLPRRDDD